MNVSEITTDDLQVIVRSPHSASFDVIIALAQAELDRRGEGKVRAVRQMISTLGIIHNEQYDCGMEGCKPYEAAKPASEGKDNVNDGKFDTDKWKTPPATAPEPVRCKTCQSRDAAMTSEPCVTCCNEGEAGYPGPSYTQWTPLVTSKRTPESVEPWLHPSETSHSYCIQELQRKHDALDARLRKMEAR